MRNKTPSAINERKKRRLMPRVVAAVPSSTTPVHPYQFDTIEHHR
jgi:hypothetical protein